MPGTSDSDERKKIEAALGRTNYFEYWAEEAALLASTRWAADPVEALQIVKTAFGEEWISSEIRRRTVKEQLRQRANDVPSWIATPGVPQVAATMELAEYLKKLYVYPKFDRVCELMRDDGSFYSAFLQCAFAYRFVSLGAQALEFEPPVDGGREADIQFFWAGRQILCECYSPTTGSPPGYVDFMAYNADAVLRACRVPGKQVIALLRPNAEVPPDTYSRGEIEKACVSAIQNGLASAQSVSAFTFGEIEVWECSTLDDNKESELVRRLMTICTCGLSNALVPLADLRAIQRGTKEPGGRKNWLFLQNPPEEIGWEHIIEKLGRKIEKKTAQLRKADKPAGLLIVETPYSAFFGLTKEEAEVHRTRLLKKLAKHSAVHGLLLVDRSFTKANCHQFRGAMIQTTSEPTLNALFEALTSLEGTLKLPA